jgi:hypothetical protein
MARAGKYGQVEIEGIPEDEPVFIIRARDRLSVAALDAYAELANIGGEVEEEFLDQIDGVTGDFKIWQRQNETKVPD